MLYRVPGDVHEANPLKVRCDQWFAALYCPDLHVPASLCKLQYRNLYEPLFAEEFYDQSIDNCNS